jgi:hypothetical protein
VLDDAEQVALELGQVARGPDQPLGLDSAGDRHHGRIGPPLERLVLPGGEAEDLGDDLDRERHRDGLDEVSSPEAGNPSMSACTISCIRPSIAPAVRRAENSEVASLR